MKTRAVKTNFLVMVNIMIMISISNMRCRLYAQADAGSVLGTVRDTSGAVIPRAKVTLTNEGMPFSVSKTSATFSSDYGLAARAVLNATIKSGTNRFRSDISQFIRNDKLDAGDFFQNAGNLSKGEFRRNPFGFAKGQDAVTVASVVLDALSSRSPRLRYPAGREAKILTLLKKLAPAQLLDKGVRKQFGLEVA